MTSPLGPEELRRRLDQAAAGPTTALFDDVFRRAERHRRTWRAGLVAATAVVVAAVVVVATVTGSGGSAHQKVIASPAPPPPLPSATPSTGMRPATLAELVGHWRAIDAPSRDRAGSVSFDYHGSWAGSDGCNSFGGRFVLGDGGLFHATIASSTQVLCGSVAPDVRWVRSAGYAWVEGNQLILLNSGGTIIGRLQRYDPADATVIGTFNRVGGAFPGTAVPLPGTIVAHLNSASGPSNSVPAKAGHFTFTLPPGRYYFVGFSPHVDGGRPPGCSGRRPRTLVAGQTIRLTVSCQIR